MSSETMRAVRVRELGGPDVLELAELQRPSPGPTEVLVRVCAAGLNPVDAKTRAKGGFMGDPPYVLGWDVAGVVEAVGFGVNRFEAGDEVLGMPFFPREAGAHAEFATGPSRQFVRKPEGMEWPEAGALPLAGLTAWQVLADVANLQPGQRVLVAAAAGGVGHLAVQVAKARGAYVIGTARGEKHEFVRSLGADEVVDYTEVDVPATVSEVDVVVDLLGGETGRSYIETLSPGGLLVSVPSGGGSELDEAAAEKGVRAVGFLVEPDELGLDALVDLFETGDLRIEVEQTFGLEQAAEAHERLESGRTRGKLVFMPGA
jgi:NADPH:quinone reductase-like Zn-dependent oxidoreductase